MLTSSIVSVDSSKVYKPKASQVGLLSTAISKLGDSSFVSKSRESTNMSPVRTRLFRDSSPKQTKGLQGVVVGEYHPLTPTHIVFSSIHKSTSPLRSGRNYNESPQRAKVRLDRFKNWDSKLGLELQIQNSKFTRLNNELTYLSHQPHHQTNRSAIFLGSNLSRLSVGGNQSDIRLLSAKLNAIPPSQIGTFTAGHSHELSSLQQSLSRIMKSSRQLKEGNQKNRDINKRHHNLVPKLFLLKLSFYDNDSDKVVIIQDEDLQYAYQQSKAFKKQSIKLYIYYKLSQPKILQLEPSIKISTQQAQQDWIFKSINENSSQSLTNSNEIQTYCQNRYTIVPEPLKTREEKLKSAIDFFIDQILKEEYQI